MKKQQGWKALGLACLFIGMLACGGSGTEAGSEPAVDNSQPKYGTFVPQLEVVREIQQTPEWGEDLNFNRLAAVSEDRIYLLDSQLMRMVAIDNQGSPVSTFLKKGQGPGEFQYYPRAQVLGDNFWLYEWQKLCRFTPDGQLLNEYRTKENYGNMIVLDENRFTGVVRTSVGKEEDSKRIMRAGLWDMKENLLVQFAESDKRGVFEMKIGESYITVMFGGGVVPSLIVAADPARNRIYTCVSDTYQIDVWDDEGNKLRTIQRDIPEVPMTDADKDEMAGGLRVGGVDENEVKKALRAQMPDIYCAIATMRVADNGYLIVERPVGYDDMELDVYQPDGTFLLTWQSPEDVKLDECLFAQGHFFRIDDSGDYPRLVEYGFVEDASGEFMANAR